MKRRVVFINFFMLMGISLMAIRFISAWENFEEAYSLEQIVNRTEGWDAPLPGIEPMSPSLPFSDFIVISERNLFSEDRRPPAVEEEEEEEGTEGEIVEEEPPKWTDRPFLHGLSVVNGKRQAILTATEAGQPAQVRTVYVGDSVQCYRVTEIGDSVVRLRWKDHEELLDMSEAHMSVPAEINKGTAAVITVITVGAAPAAVQTVSGKPDGQPQGTGIEVSVVSGQATPPTGSASAGERRAPRTPGR